MGDSAIRFPIVRYEDGTGSPLEVPVPREERVVLYVNGREWVGWMCTPTWLEELAVGFLFNEGFIDGMEEVAHVRVCGSGRCVDVWLEKDVDLPGLPTVTSGCSGGTTFETVKEEREPLTSRVNITPERVVWWMQRLHRAADLHRAVGGVHTSALAEGDRLVHIVEDVGRHNTVDKLAGYCLRRGLPTRDRILLTSGRVSSEMLAKAARMGTPVVISRTSPTSLAVDLARAWNITLIGYARGRGFRVYAGEHRIRSDGTTDTLPTSLSVKHRRGAEDAEDS
ncbi:MAG TPA: formate dehydrogenase accessory sulfurtransferase FdhD [Thermoflexia bacterium]|jgi:FdhD protein|nr:formate dehydrogenase accessory sulfurtransferase FdhD [Thermoflexia bacterium]